MWAKLASWVLNLFVLPILTRLGAWIIDAVTFFVKIKKREKVIDGEVEQVEKGGTVDEQEKAIDDLIGSRPKP